MVEYYKDCWTFPVDVVFNLKELLDVVLNFKINIKN